MIAFHRMIALYLAALLLLGAVGCAQDPNETETTASENNTVGETETADEAAEALDGVGGVDYGGGEFTVLYADETGWAYDEEVIGMANMSDAVGSGIINEAVFERNTKFEEMCKLTFVQVPKHFGQLQAILTNDIAGGTKNYQFADIGMGSAAAKGVTVENHSSCEPLVLLKHFPVYDGFPQ